MMPSTSYKLFASLLVVLWSGTLYANGNGCFSSIISFGDSIADTGNLKQLASNFDNVRFPCGPPYGQNFIGQSTGRCSNGRLIIDFLAESLGLPLIPPYFSIMESGSPMELRQGMNFAIAGSTAMDSSFVESRCRESVVINGSLGVQLAWLKKSLPFICGNITSSDCRNFIGSSLILMGEIGGNDYNIPLTNGKSIDMVRSYVPLVIDTIISTLNDLIEMGAQTLVVPGNFPIGCFPSYLTIEVTGLSGKEEYDPITGCLTKLNELSEYHNKMLQTKLNKIQEINPNVVVIYADYYNAAMQIYYSPNEYGFTNEALKACCGCGGPFNYNASARCGDVSTILCDEPDKYVSWDGVHLTEAAYKHIFKSIFQGPYTTPEFNSLCPETSTSQGTIKITRPKIFSIDGGRKIKSVEAELNSY